MQNLWYLKISTTNRQSQPKKTIRQSTAFGKSEPWQNLGKSSKTKRVTSQKADAVTPPQVFKTQKGDQQNWQALNNEVSPIEKCKATTKHKWHATTRSNNNEHTPTPCNHRTTKEQPTNCRKPTQKQTHRDNQANNQHEKTKKHTTKTQNQTHKNPNVFLIKA